MSTFKVVGVSKLNGKYKVRFANDMLRVKVLEKNGHKDVDLIELMHPMTKEDAVRKLIEMNFAKGDKAIQAALDEAIEKRTEAPKAANKQPKPSKEAKKPAKAPAKKSKVTKDVTKAKADLEKASVTKAEVAAQLAAAEDAPF